jgi:hypothetical protein
MTTTIRDNRRELDALLQRTADAAVAQVGVFDPERSLVAAVQEFGSADGHVPARSFLRAWFDENAEAVKTWSRELAIEVVFGSRTAESASTALGERIATAVRARLQSGLAPPLEDSNRVPLIDTGALLASITAQVGR